MMNTRAKTAERVKLGSRVGIYAVRPKTSGDIKPNVKNIQDLKRARSVSTHGKRERQSVSNINTLETQTRVIGDLNIRIEVVKDEKLYTASTPGEDYSNRLHLYYSGVIDNSVIYLQKLNLHPQVVKGVTFSRIRMGSLILTANCQSLKSLLYLERELKSNTLTGVLKEVFTSDQGLLEELGLSKIELEVELEEKELEQCRDGLIQQVSQMQGITTGTDTYKSRLDCARMIDGLQNEAKSEQVKVTAQYHTFGSSDLKDFLMVLKLTSTLGLKSKSDSFIHVKNDKHLDNPYVQSQSKEDEILDLRTKPVGMSTINCLADILDCQRYVARSPSVGGSIRGDLITTYLDMVDRIDHVVKEIYTQVDQWQPNLLKYINMRDLMPLQEALCQIQHILNPRKQFSDIITQSEMQGLGLGVMDKQLFGDLVNYMPTLIKHFQEVIEQIQKVHDVLAFTANVKTNNKTILPKHDNKNDIQAKSDDGNKAQVILNGENILYTENIVQSEGSEADSVDSADIREFLDSQPGIKNKPSSNYNNKQLKFSQTHDTSQTRAQSNERAGYAEQPMLRSMTDVQISKSGTAESNMIINVEACKVDKKEDKTASGNNNDQHKTIASNHKPGEKKEIPNYEDSMGEAVNSDSTVIPTLTSKVPNLNDSKPLDTSAENSTKPVVYFPRDSDPFKVSKIQLRPNSRVLHSASAVTLSTSSRLFGVSHSGNENSNLSTMDKCIAIPHGRVANDENQEPDNLADNEKLNIHNEHTHTCQDISKIHQSTGFNDCLFCQMAMSEQTTDNQYHPNSNPVKKMVFDSDNCVRGPFYRMPAFKTTVSSNASRFHSHPQSQLRSQSTDFDHFRGGGNRNKSSPMLRVSSASISDFCRSGDKCNVSSVYNQKYSRPYTAVSIRRLNQRDQNERNSIKYSNATSRPKTAFSIYNVEDHKSRKKLDMMSVYTDSKGKASHTSENATRSHSNYNSGNYKSVNMTGHMFPHRPVSGLSQSYASMQYQHSPYKLDPTYTTQNSVIINGVVPPRQFPTCSNFDWGTTIPGNFQVVVQGKMAAVRSARH